MAKNKAMKSEPVANTVIPEKKDMDLQAHLESQHEHAATQQAPVIKEPVEMAAVHDPSRYKDLKPEDVKKMGPDERDRYFKWLRDYDAEMVEGVFRFYECPGGILEFDVKIHHGDPIEHYAMVDGHTYKVPRGVARHLEMNGWYPEYAHLEGSSTLQAGFGPNNPNMFIKRKVHRYGFQSTDFVGGLAEDYSVPLGVIQ